MKNDKTIIDKKEHLIGFEHFLLFNGVNKRIRQK